MINFKTYSYIGSVWIDDHKVKSNWKAQIAAANSRDAYNRFVMKWRYLLDGVVDWPAKIVLPGKVVEV